MRLTTASGGLGRVPGAGLVLAWDGLASCTVGRQQGMCGSRDRCEATTLFGAVSSHNRAGCRLGELDGALSEWGLVRSSSINTGSIVGGFHGERKEEEREEENKVFGFSKLEFILFSIFRNEISFLHILTRVFDI